MTRMLRKGRENSPPDPENWMIAPLWWLGRATAHHRSRDVAIFLPGKKKQEVEVLSGGQWLGVYAMGTVHIYPLSTLSTSLQRRLYQTQQEAARVWLLCRDLHLAARQQHTHWPERNDLRQAIKGGFVTRKQATSVR